MNPALTSFTAGLAGLIVFAGAALVVLRLPGRLSPVGRQALLAMCIHVATVALMWWLVPTATYWHGAALYWFGFNCFLYAFSAVYKSVSLRMLSRIAAAPGNRLAVSDIVDRQISPCFTDRVALLVNSGLAQTQAGKYTALPQGLKVAGRIGLLQSIFGVEHSGLYTAAPKETAPCAVSHAAENTQVAAREK
jgi:hypothetical protein